MLRGRLCRQGTGTAGAVAMSSMLLAITTELAWGQATTPAQPPQQSETDIGRVTTTPGQGENETVVPSATTTRAAAIEMKRQAPNIIEVQPLSEIIKLPDINMAEALQRIPGISLETDSGEGRFINIRGLDSDLNASTYAGVRLPPTNPSSPFGGGRATAFDVFPTGIVGGVEVTKTLRPDMDAEGLGGSINLVPRTGAQYGGRPFFEADIGGGYQPSTQRAARPRAPSISLPRWTRSLSMSKAACSIAQARTGCRSYA